MERIHSMNKSFQRLFSRKSSIDLTEITTLSSLSSNKNGGGGSGAGRPTNTSRSLSLPSSGSSSSSSSNGGGKHFNTITSQHVTLTTAESEHLVQLHAQFAKLTYYDQYACVQKAIAMLVDIYKSLDTKNYLPRLQYVQFLFDLMESHVNVFNLMLFAIRLLHVGPLVEKYLRAKFLNNQETLSSSLSSSGSVSSSRIIYFEYLSHFYLNIVGVLRLHLISLVLWKDLATEVFKR